MPSEHQPNAKSSKFTLNAHIIHRTKLCNTALCLLCTAVTRCWLCLKHAVHRQRYTIFFMYIVHCFKCPFRPLVLNNILSNKGPYHHTTMFSSILNKVSALHLHIGIVWSMARLFKCTSFKQYYLNIK